MSEQRRLRLERTLHAPRERVFAACVDPKELAKWWGPAGFTSPSIELDLRVGGRYRIAMQPPEGELFYLAGEYVAIDPPSRLAYTFRWEDPDPDDRENVVTITLRDVEGETEMVVDQRPFATEARLALHVAGWTDGLERLDRALSDWRVKSPRAGSSRNPTVP